MNRSLSHQQSMDCSEALRQDTCKNLLGALIVRVSLAVRSRVSTGTSPPMRRGDGLVVGTTAAGTGWMHRATQAGRAGIVDATLVTDPPRLPTTIQLSGLTAVDKAGIGGSPIELTLQAQ